jgi:RNA polymerase sigma-70 factor (ECF subfamily)
MRDRTQRLRREAFDRALAVAKSPAEAAHIRLQIDRLTRKKDAAG